MDIRIALLVAVVGFAAGFALPVIAESFQSAVNQCVENTGWSEAYCRAFLS